MENKFDPYECQFSIDERKRIVAQTIQEIRKAKGFSQKEVAALLGISQPRYSGYETGRTEPPIEILVRLSYLYNVSVDIIVQRDRLYRTNKDVKSQIEEMQAQVEQLEQQMRENGGSNPATEQVMKLLQKTLEELQKFSKSPEIKEQLEMTLEKEN